VQAAIVTGSSSGIGRGIALAFAEAGVGLVVCADLQPVPKIVDSAAWEVAPEETSRATHEIIAARHGIGRALFVRCDVSVERVGELLAGEVVGVEGPRVGEKVWGMADLVAETVRRAGRLDV
jgi:NAD(P)-dependent dehydrogenase (short-subunit alcohol dehydrogenase family)